METLISMTFIAIIICLVMGLGFYFLSKFYPDPQDVKCKVVKRYKFKDEQ